ASAAGDDVASARAAGGGLRRPVAGPVYRAVRWISALDALAFAGLLFFWLSPGYEHQTMLFGWAHGLGYIALCLAIWIAILRHEAPYTLLAATLTPVGPFGSVIAIEWIDRRARRESSSSQTV
ncbi:MAG TPA: hypothetical protein VFD37_07670, partial [Solirubrobacterales bacterium]|nr:hypothetical protein [Solirubrobacterales bacterium]